MLRDKLHDGGVHEHLLPDEVVEWTRDDVEWWLGTQSFSAVFLDTLAPMDIDGQLLCVITKRDLLSTERAYDDDEAQHGQSKFNADVSAFLQQRDMLLHGATCVQLTCRPPAPRARARESEPRSGVGCSSCGRVAAWAALGSRPAVVALVPAGTTRTSGTGAR